MTTATDPLVRRVETLTEQLAALPDTARRLADERQAALAELTRACGSGAAAAKCLGWPSPTVYRVLRGYRTAQRKGKR